MSDNNTQDSAADAPRPVDPAAKGRVSNATLDDAEPTAEDYAAAERVLTADTNTADAETDDGDDQGDIGKVRREAAKLRTRAKTAEAERDQANELLARTRQSIVDDALTTAGVDPRLLTAAGHSIESFIDADTGLIDRDQLAEAIEAVRDEFKLPRGFTPNRSQGAGGQPPPPAKPSLADAFRQQ
ncbi:hypothetical protein [Mycobacterium talmoniae]|uniref:Scaffolding protein n=1 Tax=Mycobacterium talmoniae TaxID=1858794 RepID=A0A1S1NJ62_9MYCO|nr:MULTISPECIES: hypothetical protein [Mycobacterium]OHV03889.1 hypothetical protein BKN37_12730 [Mycobacterium talmoniae]PQM48071.1 hypothetical protein C1Y40_01706 [Mycobacterium talmoniae]TDH51568.1 hypothetical protein E2F47_15920 [Mycobacterium eburneum]